MLQLPKVETVTNCNQTANKGLTKPYGKQLLLSKLFLLCLLVSSFLSIDAKAQIIGADLSYNCLGQGKYEIVLNIFQPCSMSSQKQAEHQNIFIIEAMGHRSLPAQLKFISAENKTIVSSAICEQQSSCVVQAIYKVSVDLMPMMGGYNIVWTSCCIQVPLANVNTLNGQGFNLVAFVPGSELAEKNSMPAFNTVPQISFCKGQPSTLNINGSDVDGDSLSYEMMPAFAIKNNNASNSNHSNSMLPDPPPYQSTLFNEGFMANEPLGTKAVSLDGKIGSIQITPSLAGNFLFGYSIKEYRKGKLLSTHQRVTIVTVQ